MPATIPIIEPVPRPESEEDGWEAAVDVVFDEAGLVRVVMTSEALTMVRLPVAVEVSVALTPGPPIVDRVWTTGEVELTEEVVTVELLTLSAVVVVPNVLMIVVVGLFWAIWVATKCEIRRERKTDDHFMFVVEGARRSERLLEPNRLSEPDTKWLYQRRRCGRERENYVGSNSLMDAG